jgi:PAS domain S-box-containing protein
MSDMVSDVDAEGFFQYISPSHQRILGYRPEDLLGTAAFDKFHPDDKDRVSSIYMEGVITKTDNEAEYRYRHADGHYVWLRSSGHIILDGAGEYVGSIINSSDITERKQANEALRQSEARYRALVENASDIIFRTDNTGHFTFVNPAALRITGYTEEVIIGMHYPALIHPDMRSEAIKFFGRQFVKGLHTAYSEYPIITKEGHEIWLGQNTQLIVENGNVTGFQSVARDITDRRQAEEALQKSEENFRLSLDSSPLGVRISTIEAETLYANRAILDIYGFDSIEEMNKTPVKERYTPQSYAEYEIRKEKRTRGEFVPSEYEISIVRKNGEIRNLQVFRKEVIWNGTKQSQVIYKDITEHKRAEEKLIETLASLRESIKTTIQVLGTASEARDPYTAGHQKRVADLARIIATEMGLPHDTIEGIRMAGSIHDIGKLSIPTEILSKPTKLTEIEFSLIKEHAQSGYEILKDVESPWPLAQIVYQHHERMNGSGYPRNLKGDEIILDARIMAVADVVEAMASYRLYRPTLGIEAALEEIQKNKGNLYDDTVADACLRLFREKGYQLK